MCVHIFKRRRRRGTFTWSQLLFLLLAHENSGFRDIKRKKLDIPRHTTECIWNLVEGDHFLLRNIQIQVCGIGRLSGLVEFQPLFVMKQDF